MSDLTTSRPPSDRRSPFRLPPAMMLIRSHVSKAAAAPLHPLSGGRPKTPSYIPKSQRRRSDETLSFLQSL